MDEAPKFAADRMLARLARWLRLLGADVLHDGRLGGAELLAAARRENRIVLTRDKRLRTAPDVVFIESNYFRAQLKQVLQRFPFDTHRNAFTRCSYCNLPLRVVSREAVMRRVPPFVYASQEHFAECEGCGRIYWPATHSARILAEIAGFGP
ncbi:MAG TPA: Mut7-C RNAse domain-containing protein [Candidatus Binataceae bacterium]|nr:Mut7-C RNAse domain-containing protein [Candidatus Binataceae bacterium]